MSMEPVRRSHVLATKIVKASTLAASETRITSGVPEIDRLLGVAGLARGSLVDLHADEGARALELALAIAAHVAAAPRAILLVDTTGDFYPPAAAQAGVDLERLVVIRAPVEAARATSRRAQAALGAALGAVDEALRSKAVGAAIARLPRIDAAASHRLRVAAESGGSLGLFIRPLEERTEVSAAAVRLLVEPRARGGLRLAPIRIRGTSRGA